LITAKAIVQSLDMALKYISWACIWVVLFGAGWWLRPLGLPRQPYHLGFVLNIFVVLVIVLWVARGLPGLLDSLRDGRRWYILPLWVLAAWALFSAGWSTYRDVTVQATAAFFTAALFAVAVTCVSPPTSGSVCALLAGLAFTGAITLGQFANQNPLGLTALGEFGIRPNRESLSVLRTGDLEMLRPYGLTVHPNVAAGYLAAGLLAGIGFLAERNTLSHAKAKGAILFLLACGAYILGLAALLVTFSRGGWGALAVGGLWAGGVFVAAKAYIRWHRLAGLVAVAAILGMAFVVGHSQFLRARTLEGSQAVELQSVVQRQIFIDIASQMIAEHPLQGVGLGAFAWESRSYILKTTYAGILRAENVHNLPLLITAELGLIGFGLFAWAMMAALWRIGRHWRNSLGVGLAAGAVALLAGGLVDQYMWGLFPMLTLLFALPATALAAVNTTKSLR
jgi:O-antigen ligase